MAYQKYNPPSFQEPLDFTQIVFKQINACRETRKIPELFFKEVETLCDLLRPYWDDDLDAEMKKHELKPDLSNPYFNSASDEAKEDAARALFRALISLIHRSGFLPFREVEVIIE